VLNFACDLALKMLPGIDACLQAAHEMGATLENIWRYKNGQSVKQVFRSEIGRRYLEEPVGVRLPNGECE
jgi:hypothetical protein